MNERHTVIIENRQWSWVEVNPKIINNGEKTSSIENWWKRAQQVKANNIEILYDKVSHEPVINGMLHDVSAVDADQLFYFSIRRENLYTAGAWETFLDEKQKDSLLTSMPTAANGFEAFLCIVQEMLGDLLDGIDNYEEKISHLEEKAHAVSSKTILTDIFERREELLFLKLVAIPIEETVVTLKEAMLDELINTTIYKRTNIRLERVMTLLNHYDNQIGTLLDLNMNLFSYRANEIINALTIFTVMTTPVIVLGALWGMNFDSMPELSMPFGYGFAWLIILIFTLLIYFWLRRKGWLGNKAKPLKTFKKVQNDRNNKKGHEKDHL